MSLATALASAPPGSVIHLASGSYPAVSDKTIRTDWVTITGSGDASPPTIAGAYLWGSQYVRFVGVTFSHEVYIRDSPYAGEKQPAEHIQIFNSEINCDSTTGTEGTTGIMVRTGSQDVTLSGDYVHNCVVGFGSVAQDQVSTGVSITHSTFANFPGDAIDLGGMSGVVIDHDVIRNITDPAGIYHNDAIQFFGNVQHVQITNNVIANSRDQLVFIQDAIRSRVTGSSTNSDILVAQNLIYGAGGWAIQNQGGLDVRFVGNTMWSNHWGSLLNIQSVFTRISPSDTVIVDNIIQGLTFTRAAAKTDDYNLLTAAPSGAIAGVHDQVRADPLFVSALQGDFQLLSASPAYGAASAALGQPLLAALASPAPDLYGNAAGSTTNIGALQNADPDTGYGAPIYGPAPLL